MRMSKGPRRGRNLPFADSCHRGRPALDPRPTRTESSQH
jgi:hypothetical protein